MSCVKTVKDHAWDHAKCSKKALEKVFSKNSPETIHI